MNEDILNEKVKSDLDDAFIDVSDNGNHVSFHFGKKSDSSDCPCNAEKDFEVNDVSIIVNLKDIQKESIESRDFLNDLQHSIATAQSILTSESVESYKLSVCIKIDFMQDSTND